MILYNVTVKVDLDIEPEWKAWMQEVHIPDVMKTGLFTDHKFCRLLEQDESDGITYAIQYFCRNMEDYFTYRDKYAPELQQKHAERYADKFVAFRTLLKVIT